MSNYPNAYCIKCKSHTETVGRHTVVMQNGARALHGMCPKCESEVFQIVGKKKADEAAASSTPKQDQSASSQTTRVAAAVYPDAYCVKCKTTTKALKGHTVILSNDRRALRGVCPSCDSEIYKILPKNKDYSVKSDDDIRARPEAKPVSLAVTRLSDDHEKSTTMRDRMKYVLDGAIVTGVMILLGLAIWVANS